MNKAFVRESDAGSDRCPRCGAPGVPVGAVTLENHVRAEHRGDLAESGWFCLTPACSVAYFDMFERTCEVGQLTRPVFPKDPTAPLCGCFGFTCDDVEEDLRENTVTRTRALIERAQSPEARCSALAADGRSCVGEVQRYYMRRRAEG